MAFNITYTKLLEVAFWPHRLLRTDSYDPNAGSYDITGYTAASGPFLLTLNPGVPHTVLDQLLAFDLREHLLIQPSPATALRLKNLGLTFRTTTTGFWVVNSDQRPLPALDNLRLTFMVKVWDRAFVDQLLISDDWPETHLFHLTNAQSTSAIRFLLSQVGSEEVLHEDHFYPRQGRVVRLPQLTLGQATTLEVFDDLANPADPAVLSIDFDAIADQEEYELDCRALTEGRYRIRGANIDELTLYLGLEDQPGLLGVIDLFPRNWEGTLYDIRLAEATA
ncbi:MAG: hypothetical protein D6772_06585 [Bacteroidetes bacterium]|nr:MAG: hypothetical protein D6772_06585 [Bacteroidota bacterium]